MNKKMLITFLCFSAISPMMAQDIKGKIVDEKDQPLASWHPMLSAMVEKQWFKLETRD